MPDDLTDTEIAMLCQVGSSSPQQASATQLAVLPRLIEKGFVEIDSDPALSSERYKLTKKGSDLLTERGVGLNES